MSRDDLEIFAVTVRRPEDAQRFLREHLRRHGARRQVVRIAGPEGPVRDSLLLQRQAVREMEKGEGTVTLSWHNLPPTSPHEANVHWYRRTPNMEMRLHVQREGEPGLLEVIAEQEKLDWEEAREHCILANRPVPPRGETEKRPTPGGWVRRLKRILGRAAPALAVILVGVGAACTPAADPERAEQLRPPTLTGEIEAYAECLDRASRHRFHQVHSRDDRNLYARARCRLLEPPGMTHRPGSPVNDRCSDRYFAWYRAEHGSVSKYMDRFFAETVCAARPPGTATVPEEETR